MQSRGGFPLKKGFRDYLILALIAGAIIVLDQWTKALVRNNLALGESWMPWEWLRPFARVLHWYNNGVAFGLFQNGGIIFIILPILVVLAIIFYYPQVPNEEWSLRLAMGLQLGGALGNLIDRLTIGHVTDFISVGNFPIFNIADSAITVGVIVLILGVWIQDRREKARTESASQEASADPNDPNSEMYKVND
jgi:signal peptidase II